MEEARAQNLELERRDGVQRHFHYDWEAVARHNPLYLKFVEAERARLGEDHPLFQTQYLLKPLSGGGRFLSPAQRAQLQGDHPRLQRPAARGTFVAGIDLAGEAEDPARRDATVVTIGELDFSVCDEVLPEPRVKVVAHYSWEGVPHAALYPRLRDLLKNVWGCRRVVVDATGVGLGVASFLQQSLGSTVAPFLFTAPAKSRLGFDLLSAVNSGRLKMYAPDGSEECREFWRQVERARSFFRPSQTMNFFVDRAEGHDDFLMSLALLVQASHYLPRSARGRVREER